MRLLLAVESCSTHPIATALCAAVRHEQRRERWERREKSKSKSKGKGKNKSKNKS